MRFDKKYKLHEVGDAFLDGAHLVARSGASFAAVPVEVGNGDDGIIPAEAIKEATKGRSAKSTTAEIDAEAKESVYVDTAQRTTLFTRPETDPTFDWRGLVNDSSESIELIINAAVLARLAKALGTEDVVLTIRPDTCVMVRPLDKSQNEAYGGIMPMSRDTES